MGYGGSGPVQLALAILAEHLGDNGMAVCLHQAFKWPVLNGDRPPDSRSHGARSRERLVCTNYRSTWVRLRGESTAVQDDVRRPRSPTAFDARRDRRGASATLFNRG